MLYREHHGGDAIECDFARQGVLPPELGFLPLAMPCGAKFTLAAWVIRLQWRRAQPVTLHRRGDSLVEWN
jgi:hypothetical protein